MTGVERLSGSLTPEAVEEALAMIDRCYEEGWTDGLPVVPPTRTRVEAMLGERADRRDEPVARLGAGGAVATLEKVAANAVMAGCLPSYLPVVEAAVRAIAHPRIGLEGLLTTVYSMSPLVLVGGQLATELEMNGDTGALGAGCRANAAIGRALMLTLRNVAGARPGGLEAATLGHPGKYSYCYTENVALSPWPPLHVELGFAPEDSTVTVYGADAPLCVAEMGSADPEAVLRTLAESAAIPGTHNAFFRRSLWLVLSPDHAGILAAGGLSRADVARELQARATIPAGRLRGRGLYGFADDPDHLARPAWLDEAGDDEPIPIVERPEGVFVTVAGGPYGGYSAICFGSVNGPVTEVVRR